MNDLLSMYHLDGSAKFRFHGFESVIASRSKSLPNPVSFFEFFKKYCDLQRPLSSASLRKMLSVCSVEDAKKLENLPKEELLFLTIPEVLQMFESLRKASVERVIDMLPPQRPVYYSIASSSKIHPQSVRLVVGKNIFSARNGSLMEGLCSSFLARVVPGQQIEGHVNTSSFRLPNDPNIPIIMIGVSSGLAPFIGFMEERVAGGSRNNLLYFGCMRRSQDFIYSNQLSRWEKDAFLDLQLAFSHDGPELVFVQHLMLQQAAKIWTLLQQGAYVFVCGHVKMGEGTLDALRKIVRMYNSEEETTKFMDKLFETSRLKSDVFA